MNALRVLDLLPISLVVHAEHWVRCVCVSPDNNFPTKILGVTFTNGLTVALHIQHLWISEPYWFLFPFDDLCLQADQNMFRKVLRNPNHVAPPSSSGLYHLARLFS